VRVSHPQYRNGTNKTHGYVRVLVGTDHPMANSKGYAYEHRLVMVEKIGRMLAPGEVVHHIDRNGENNDPENLMLFASHGEHKAFEQSLR
jgi:hypothetical protein